MDLVSYWQGIVVTLETVIASIELAGIIMQVRTPSTVSLIVRVCLGAEVRLYNAGRQRLKSSDMRPICRLPYYRLGT